MFANFSSSSSSSSSSNLNKGFLVRLYGEDAIRELTDDQKSLLNKKIVRAMIDERKLTFKEAIALRPYEVTKLSNFYIRQYVDAGMIQANEVKNLNQNQWDNLTSEQISQLIFDRRLTFAEATALSRDARFNLETEAVQQSINSHLLTLQDAIGLKANQRVSLANPIIKELIDNRYLTYEQSLNLTFDQYDALMEPAVRNGLIANPIALVRFLRRPAINQRQPRRREQELNDSQSTHTQSIHDSASASAKELSKRYRIDNNLLDKTIEEIQAWGKTIEEKGFHERAAAAAITRLTKDDFAYIDKPSDVSIKQLLALAWHAIHDNNNRPDSNQNATAEEEKQFIIDAKQRLIEGLYEIERGYNIDDFGIDDGSIPNAPICGGGTFNKLIEKLVGSTQGVSLSFITKASATLKLPLAVQDAVEKYINSLSTSSTEKDRIIKSIKEIGFESKETLAWETIKDAVAISMQEYQVAFTTKKEFLAFIDGGEYTNFSNFGRKVDSTETTEQKQNLSSSGDSSLNSTTAIAKTDNLIFNPMPINNSAVANEAVSSYINTFSVSEEKTNAHLANIKKSLFWTDPSTTEQKERMLQVIREIIHSQHPAITLTDNDIKDAIQRLDESFKKKSAEKMQEVSALVNPEISRITSSATYRLEEIIHEQQLDLSKLTDRLTAFKILKKEFGNIPPYNQHPHDLEDLVNGKATSAPVTTQADMAATQPVAAAQANVATASAALPNDPNAQQLRRDADAAVEQNNVHQMIHLAQQANQTSWGKKIAAALFVLAGALILAASTMIAVASFGGASPLSSLGITIGSSIAVKALSIVCVAAGAGVIGVGATQCVRFWKQPEGPAAPAGAAPNPRVIL